jgi:hypothetical protein
MDTKSYTFGKLTPVDDADISVYENAINYVFKNEDIKNVAISGAYGAGKSSLLASYKKKNSEHKFMHISLAHFKSLNENNSTSDEPNNEGNSVDMADLEGKILNQLIHQIPTENIQQTHFKIKRTVKGKTIILQTAAIVIFILALLHVVLWSDWHSYVDLLDNNLFMTLISFTTNPYSRLISGAITVGLSTWFVYRMVKMQTNKNLFKKLNLQGNEIEIFENDDDSYFDKYLNEVLYLFENANVDVIVFEDMDRFETNSIFERLREINTLANIQLKNEKKKPLRFFYLLRDDIFVSKDRTKFFDFIIPVIPVVDSSNSYNQFIDLLKENNLFEKFDESFLQGLSLYTDDMRLLINICNEFLVYINRLNITELDYNKMLAIITYKNVFPRDFSELQVNRGFIYSLFSKKSEYIELSKKDLEKRISEKEIQIKNAQNELLESIQELDDVYDAKKRRAPRNYLQSQEYEKKLNAWYDNEYPKRKQAIENKINNKISELELDLQELKSRLLSLKSRKLFEIITRENIDDIFKSTTINEIGKEEKYLDIKGNPYFSLLKYLVRNEYIDESYPDYMTYFYENNLTRTDKIFLRSVTDRKAREYTYQIDKPEMVVARLKIADFDQEETLNFSLLIYLLKTDIQSEMVAHLMCQLKKYRKFDFIGRYIEYGQALSEFITALYVQWDSVLEVIINNNILSTTLTKQLLLLTLYYASSDVIKNANINNCLTDYISSDEKFLKIEQPNIQKIIDGFILLNVSFTDIDYEVSNKELFTAVYQDSLYELNYNNLAIMLRYVHNIESEIDIKHQNYTLILSIQDSPLNNMVEDNISEYVNVILDSCEKQIDDSEDTVINLLNNAEIDNEQKELYIDYMTNKISLLSQIEDSSLWRSIIDKSKLKFSELNILEYYAKFNVVDQHIVDYINNINPDIDMSNIPKRFKEIEPSFFNSIIKCEELKNDYYYKILKTMNQYYTSFGIKDISDGKMKILININTIRMNNESIKFIRENYSSKILIYYILHYIKEYINILDDETFSFDELIILLSENIEDELKLELLSYSDKPISIINTNYSIAIKMHILNNNLNTNDVVYLYKTYDTQPKEIKNFIIKYAETDYKTIINQISVVSSVLKNQLLESSLLLDKKVEIFIAMAENQKREQAVIILNKIGLTEYEKIFLPRHKPKIKINNLNKLILNLFVQKKWIDSFEMDTNKGEYYKVKKYSFSKK